MKILSLVLVFCFFSCQDLSNNSVENATQNTFTELITKEDIKKFNYIEFVLDSKVEKAIDGWEKYYELERIIVDVKAANLSFFKDNNEILATLNEELKTTIPEKINSPLIMSRIIALETKMYKLESVVNLSNPLKNTILAAVKELLEAFSNLNLQMNKKVEKESQRIQRPT